MSTRTQSYHRYDIILTILVAVHLCLASEEGERIVCVFHESSNPRLIRDDVQNGEISKDNHTITCTAGYPYCYSLWKQSDDDSLRKVVVKQGCWDQTDKSACDSASCETRSPPSKDAHFCCCYGNMCNTNFSDTYVPPPPTTPGVELFPRRMDRRYQVVVAALAPIFLVSVIIALLYLAWRLWRRSRKEARERQMLQNFIDAPSTPPPPFFDLDNLELCEIVDKGRYGKVWKGRLQKREVAVKVYQGIHKEYYLNEKAIYMLPHMDHKNLLCFYGGEERSDLEGLETDMVHFVIVMEYASLGTLKSYLANNTYDWQTMCNLALSITQGLVHLHTKIIKGDVIKPAIAHRDFNSRNILVKSDLTCALCDFGFAMEIKGSNYIRNGLEENAEQSSITEVGTLRYMAPEVLEGAVNLRDCETSLKQIDVYSLGLVLWEVATRCSDLYQGLPVPCYKMPYENEVGLYPTLEKMTMCVVRNKSRPQFHEVWKDTNQAIRALKETIDDCWDQDAEARLTSMCIEERIYDMMTLWEARLKGVTPTLSQIQACDRTSIVRNRTYSDSLGLVGAGLSTDTAISSQTSRGYESSYRTPANGQYLYSRLPMESSVSNSTTDTLLSPSDNGEYTSSVRPPPVMSLKSNVNRDHHAPANRAILQPHQGKNPTVERNTHCCSEEELAVMGNRLVKKAVAEAAAEQLLDEQRRMSNTAPRTDTVRTSAALTNNLIDVIADNLESSLVQNDQLSQDEQQALHPPSGLPVIMPASAAATSSSSAMIVRPKQPNLPLNASNSSPLQKQNNCKQSCKSTRKNNNKGRSKKGGKSEQRGRLSMPTFLSRNLFSRNSSDCDSDDNFPTENLRDPTPLTGSQRHSMVMVARQQGHSTDTEPAPSTGRSDYKAEPLDTEVCMFNGSPRVRPTSLPLQAANHSQYNVDAATASRHDEAKLLNINRIDDSSACEEASLTMECETLEPGSKSSITDTPDASQDVYKDANNALIKLRHQNPGDKKNRYSLYDDRIMSHVPSKMDDKNAIRKSSISLQQFGSSDSSMNNVQAADIQC